MPNYFGLRRRAAMKSLLVTRARRSMCVSVPRGISVLLRMRVVTSLLPSSRARYMLIWLPPLPSVSRTKPSRLSAVSSSLLETKGSRRCFAATHAASGSTCDLTNVSGLTTTVRGEFGRTRLILIPFSEKIRRRSPRRSMVLRYSSVASATFLNASSMVSPKLAVPSSRHRETKCLPSAVTSRVTTMKTLSANVSPRGGVTRPCGPDCTINRSTSSRV